MLESIILIIILLLTLLFIYIIRKLFESPDKNWRDTVNNDPEFTSEYETVVIKSIFMILPLIPFSVYICYKILGFLFVIHRNIIGDYLYIIDSRESTLLLGSLFMGVSLASILVFIWFKLRHKSKFKYVVAGYNNSYGFNGYKTIIIISIISYLIGFFPTIFVISDYTLISSDKITVNNAFDLFPKHYTLDEISGLYFATHKIAPNGNMNERPHYILEFSNGEFVSTKTGLREPFKTDPEIFDFLSKKTNIELKTIKLYENE